MNTHEIEREKYVKAWSSDAYRQSPSPGQKTAKLAIERLVVEPGSSVADFGCGDGRAMDVFQSCGLRPLGVDIVKVEGATPVIVTPLWDLPSFKVDFGFCADVMEHIPTDKVAAVLHNTACVVVRGAFFQIAMFPDELGRQVVGTPLHLTVETPEFWDHQMRAAFGRRAHLTSWVDTSYGNDYPYYMAFLTNVSP